MPDLDLHNIARLERENAALRAALQRYVDASSCEYADDPEVCPGDPPYVAECHWHEAVRALAQTEAARPTIVCLCGSTRFWRTFQQASLQETMAGRIVLSIGAASGTDDEHFGNLPRDEYDRVKAMLDELHLRKIDLLVLNVEDYVGESTARELAYARAHGKVVRFLEEEGAS